MGRGSRWWTLLGEGVLLLTGGAHLAWLLSIGTRGCCVNVDASIKLLAVRALARGHGPTLTPESLPVPGWCWDLWEQGMGPFAPPFGYPEGEGIHIGFPLSFPLASVPGWLALGDPGLLLLPALAVLATWILALAWFRRRDAVGSSAGGSLVGLALLLFGTPLSVYGACFWEHAPAVALATLAVPCVTLPGLGRGARILGGLALGAATWLRPEAVMLAAAVLWVFRARDGWRPALLSTILALTLLPVANLLLYGHPHGVHGIQVAGRFLGTQDPWDILRNGRDMLGLVWEHVPWVALLPWVLLAPSPAFAEARRLVWVLVLMGVGTFAIVPNAGGLEFGPRYLLLGVPVLVAATLSTVDALGTRFGPWARWAALGAVALLAGSRGELNLREMGWRLDFEMAWRQEPGRVLQTWPQDLLVVVDVADGQFLADRIFDGRPVVRASNGAALVLAEREAHARGLAVLLLDHLLTPVHVPGPGWTLVERLSPPYPGHPGWQVWRKVGQ